MASYPVNAGDADSLLDAVNYAISGPSGLGQQLEGFSSSTTTRLTGNYRVPYTNDTSFLPEAARLYVEPIALGNSYWLDDYTYKHEFATAQAYPPFAIGNNITIDGVTPSDFDGTYRRIGVVSCTVDYVIAKYNFTQPNPGVVGTGGTASLWVTSPASGTNAEALISTDANAIVEIDTGNNLVSVSGQLDLSAFDYAVLTTEYPFTVPSLAVSVKLNRYRAFNSGTAANPVYFYEPDATISSQQIYSTNLTEATQNVPLTYNIISGTSAASSIGFYPDIVASSTTGSGTNARIWVDITADSTAYSTSLSFVSVEYGGNYQVGDLLTFSGTDLGGTSPANDLVLEVATVGGIGDIEAPKSLTVFTPIIDQPEFSGLYWYIIEVEVDVVGEAEVAVKSMAVNRRSLTAQVIKK